MSTLDVFSAALLSGSLLGLVLGAIRKAVTL